jgi:hypothetical protein
MTAITQHRNHCNKEALAAFDPQFEAARDAGLRRKLGLFTEREGMRR